MTSIANHLWDLEANLGFMPEPFHTEWFMHEDEPVRFIWTDPEARSFRLVRYEGRIDGLILATLSGSNLDRASFVAVVRGFLHG